MQLGDFANTIFKRTYAFDENETWDGCAARVAKEIATNEEQEASFFDVISKRKFVPGGRYLAQSGREIKQFNNCFLLRCEDSREGWGDLLNKHVLALSTGGGCGTNYSEVRERGTKISKFGGIASGPVSVMSMVNEVARHVMAGGRRRSALWGGLAWWHPDVKEFIQAKNWTTSVKAMKEQDFNFPATLDMTNISVCLDDAFFKRIKKDKATQDLYYQICKSMCKTGEPGLSVDLGEKSKDSLRNPSMPAGSLVGTDKGIFRIETLEGQTFKVKSIDGKWADAKCFLSGENEPVYTIRLGKNKAVKSTAQHQWPVLQSDGSIVKKGTLELKAGDKLPSHRNELYGLNENQSLTKDQGFLLGYLFGDGWISTRKSGLQIGQKVLGITFSSEKVHLAQRLLETLKCLGSGDLSITSRREGTEYTIQTSDNKFITLLINKFIFTGDKSKGLPSCIWTSNDDFILGFVDGLISSDGHVSKTKNEIILDTSKKNVAYDFVKLLSFYGVRGSVYEDERTDIRFPNKKNYNKTYYSYKVHIDKNQFRNIFDVSHTDKKQSLSKGISRSKSYERIVSVVQTSTEKVWDITVYHDQHVFPCEYVYTGNCCEVTSADSNDVCNLGSINLSRIENLNELEDVTRIAVRFLYNGTFKSWLPHSDFYTRRELNRRIGLGLMGLHEWCILNNEKYEPSGKLGKWLHVWQATSDDEAIKYAVKCSSNRPVAVRAIAPTGCQSPDTLIITEDGILELQELGDIKGDRWQSLNLLVGQDVGEFKNATRFFINGQASTKKIYLSSGLSLEATLNHQYRVIRDTEYTWVQSKDLKIGDKVVVRLGAYNKSTNPPLITIDKHYRTENDISLPKEVTPELAKFLGIFFADGSIHSKGIRIACNAKELDYLEVARLGESLFGVKAQFLNNGRNCMSVVFNSSLLLRWLYVNNLVKNESKVLEIPAVIRCFSRECLYQFIQGFYFGDGSSSNSAKYYDTASLKFANQLAIILRALGIDCAIQTSTNNSNHWGGTMYRIREVATKRRCHSKNITSILTKLNLVNCTVDEITHIKDSACLTLDIEVPETKTYIANSIVSHNTIGIIAETTTGIEPIFCTAYKRRFLDSDGKWKHKFVIDPTAERLIIKGVDPNTIEDSLSLAKNVERRISMQAYVQDFVDMAISSTINMPEWGEHGNSNAKKFAETLLKYLPKLRGITVYPDGARPGQPITPVEYEVAKSRAGVVFEESDERCAGGVCGI